MLKEISRKALSKKKAIILLAGVLLLCGVVIGIILYRNSPSQRQARIQKTSNVAANLSDQSNYSAASQQYIKAYGSASSPADKANLANNAAQAYEAAIDYKAALQWYNIALQQYHKAGDTLGASNAQDSISRVTNYQQVGSKPQPQSSAVGDGGN